MNTVLSAGVCGLLLAVPAIGQVADTETMTTETIAPETIALVEPAPSMPGSSVVTEYEIRMFRPARVGQQMNVKCFGMQEQTTMAKSAPGNQPMKAATMSVDFEAKAEVKAVNADGRASRVVYTVKRCTVTRDRVSHDPIAAGTKITARLDSRSQTEFEMNGRPVPADLAASLSIAAGLDYEGMREDTILGTERPRAVRETWAIDRNQMSRMLQEQANMTVDPSNISGVTTLADVSRHAGHECLVLYSNVLTENTALGANAVPPGFDVKDGSMTMTVQRMLPRDARMPALSESSRMEAEFVLAQSTSPSVEMVCRFVQSMEREVSMNSRTTSVDTDAAAPSE